MVKPPATGTRPVGILHRDAAHNDGHPTGPVPVEQRFDNYSHVKEEANKTKASEEENSDEDRVGAASG